jgi:mannonate dehydratase
LHSCSSRGWINQGLPQVTFTDVKLILTKVGRGNGAHMTNVNVLTSEPGLYGVGCGTHNERAYIVAETIDKFMKPIVVGRDVGDIEHIWQTAWVAPDRTGEFIAKKKIRR